MKFGLTASPEKWFRKPSIAIVFRNFKEHTRF